MPNTTAHEAAAIAMQLPVGKTCQWDGTTYEGAGKEARLLPCGAITVGKGLFCNLHHNHCFAADICERHDNNGITTNWDDVEGGWDA